MHKFVVFFLFLALLSSAPVFAEQDEQQPSQAIVTEKIHFFHVRGLHVKEMLTSSIQFNTEAGEGISLEMDPKRDRPESGGSSHGGGGLLMTTSPGEFMLYHMIGGSLTVHASENKINQAKHIIAMMDDMPWQIQIETFYVKINHEELEKRNIEVSGVVNAIQDFTPTFLNPTLPANTFQAAIGNQIDDYGFIDVELIDSNQFINVGRNPAQRVIHGETSRILSGEKNIFKIASGQVAMVQIEETAFGVSVTPQFIPKESSQQDHDAVRLSIQIEDSSPKTNENGEVDSIDRFNTSTDLILLNGQMLPLAKLNSNNNAEKDSGTPVLRFIPLIGSLFESSIDTDSKTNYFIFIRATEYNIFDDLTMSNQSQDFQHTQSQNSKSPWYQIIEEAPYALEFSKDKKGQFQSRVLLNDEILTRPFQVQVDWKRSINPFLGLSGTRNFLTTLLSLNFHKSYHSYTHYNSPQGVFKLKFYDNSTSDWKAVMRFYTISEKGTVSNNPFLEIDDIKMKTLLDKVQ